MIHPSAYNVIINFGKHRGKSFGSIAAENPSYLEWLSQTQTIPDKIKRIALEVLAGGDVSTDASIQSIEKIIGNVTYVDATQLLVTFPYSASFLDRFKHEIDGRQWDRENSGWKFPHAQILKVVDVFGGIINIIADARTKKIYEKELQRKKDLEELRNNKISTLEINTKIKLWNEQLLGVEFIEKAGGRALIADEPGSGKTLCSIGYAVYKNLKTIIICPKSVMIMWARVIKEATGKSACILELDGITGKKDAQFHIVNYDGVSKHIDFIHNNSYDLLIADEAHLLKNRKTIRAKLIMGSYKERKKYPGIKTSHVIFLSGTPLLNRNAELFALLNFLDSQRFNNFYHFIQKYGGHKGEPARNLDELHEKTKSLVFRRLMKDVPEKQRTDIVIKLSQQDRKEYDKLVNQMFLKWNALGKPSVAELPIIQNFLFDKKKQYIIELIDKLLDSDKSILLFSTYLYDLVELSKYYNTNSVMLDGSMSIEERQENIDLLVNKKVKIGLFSLRAGSLGIDKLQTVINHVIFTNIWFVPASHEQAEGRSYRKGQLNKTQSYYIIAENTTDQYMREILIDKQKLIDKVIDGIEIGAERNKSFFGEFVKKLIENTNK